MTDGSDDDGISRRKLLAASGTAVGVAALAGCTAGDQAQEYAGTVSEAAGIEPPQPPQGTPENEYWRFVVASMEYQNQQARAQSQGIAALVDNEGLTEG